MRIAKTLFKNGMNKALTMSYDDGNIYDRRIVEIFNKNRIKGTFHLNSVNFGREKYVTAEELSTLYAGHEISAHGYTHPFLCDLNDMSVIDEIMHDRRVLEKNAGCVIRGMSYPYGQFDDRVIRLCRTVGIEYSRTVNSTGNYEIPEDFMKWNPTCHHDGIGGKSIIEKLDEFVDPGRCSRANLFYIWGHGFELYNNNQWDMMEEFCKRAGDREDIWFATNIEIVDYVNALNALRISSECNIIYNPSAVDVWVRADNEAVKIPSGETVRLN